jgi:hypothetical protein
MQNSKISPSVRLSRAPPGGAVNIKQHNSTENPAPFNNTKRAGFSCVLLMSPEHNNIISIFSDTEYMQNMYNQLLFIREMTRKEVLQN